MKLTMNATRLVFMLAFAAAVIAFSAFRQKDTTRQKTFRDGFSRGDEDTTTSRKRNRSQNEYHLDQLDSHMKIIDDQMIELEKDRKDFDVSKIQAEVDEELKKIDFDKVAREVDEAIAKIDFDKINEEIKKSNQDLAKINMEEIKKEMEKVKAELKKEKLKVDIDFPKIKQEVNESMEKAQKDMQKAKAEMNAMKEFSDVLEKDGLIDKNKSFTIEVKDGELFLNGVKQNKKVQEKYRQYLENRSFKLSNGTKAK